MHGAMQHFPDSLLPFQYADSIGDRFLALLHKQGINPPTGTNLEDELLSLTQLIEVMKNPSLVSRADQIDILRSAAGIHDLAAKMLTVEPLPDFPIGSIAAHIGTDVSLDSPTSAKGDNPDVMFTHQESDQVATRWAFAIKTIESQHGRTIFERIAHAAKQIDSPKCLADRGMVVINAKSALDHNALWDTAFPDLGSAMNALKQQLTTLINKASENRPLAEWDELFQKKVARPILFLGQSLVRLPTPAGAQTPTPLKMLFADGVNGALDNVGKWMAYTMNHLMQTILHGIPGNEQTGQMPR